MNITSRRSALSNAHAFCPRVPRKPRVKTGSLSGGSPSGWWGVLVFPLLEVDLQTELQSAHCRSSGQTRDFATFAAIHAAIWPGEVDVVEDVECIELELGFEPLRDAERLK